MRKWRGRRDCSFERRDYGAAGDAPVGRHFVGASAQKHWAEGSSGRRGHQLLADIARSEHAEVDEAKVRPSAAGCSARTNARPLSTSMRLAVSLTDGHGSQKLGPRHVESAGHTESRFSPDAPVGAARYPAPTMRLADVAIGRLSAYDGSP